MMGRRKTARKVNTMSISKYTRQSLMLSLAIHLIFLIVLSLLLHSYKRQRMQSIEASIAVQLMEERKPALRPPKETVKPVIPPKDALSPSAQFLEAPSKTSRGFLVTEKPLAQGEMGGAISPMGQGMFASLTDAFGLRRELPIGAGVSVKGGREMLSGSGKGGEILPTVGVERESVSEVGKGDVGLTDLSAVPAQAGGVNELAKGGGDVDLEITKVERFKPVIPQRGKFGKQAGLSMLGDIGVADADDTLANVAKDMILNRTGFFVPELPKGEPGGVIIGRGKEIEGRLRFGRLSCSMVDERLIQGFAGVLNYWIKWINANTNIKVDINVEGGAISLTDANLFKSPILFLFGYNEGMHSIAGWYATDPTLTGKNRWTSGGQAANHLSSTERQQLRKYLVEKGGVLFVDTLPQIISSYYGNQKTLGPPYPWSTRMKRELRTILPEYNFQKIPNEHQLYHSFYDLGGMPPGLPKTKSGTDVASAFFGFLFSPSAYLQGISIDDKLAVIYSENAIALIANNHGNFDYLSTRAAFRFLTNVVVYGLTHSGISDKSRYVPQKEIQESAEEIPKKPPFIPQPTPNLRP